ncbi:hypothetical protein JW887_05310 [Candidatus Dojkabacteria bacterium]|nr:hypothetical protein [Candidatus Dojkabacteria bacterium]
MTISPVIYILISLILSLIIAPLIIEILYRLKFRQHGKVEVQEHSKTKKTNIGVPIMGGIIIILTVTILYFSLGMQNRLGYLPLIIILGGGIIGFLDDFYDVIGKKNGSQTPVVYSDVNPIVYCCYPIWLLFKYLSWPFKLFSRSVDDAGSVKTGLQASKKLFIEIIVSFVIAILIYQSTKGANFWLPVIGDLNIGFWSVLITTSFFVIFALGFSVADGIDGLSAGNHAISFAILGVVCYALGFLWLGHLCMVVVGSELTFYYFNIPPARVEMSDIGTIPLGLLFAFIAISINRAILLPFFGVIFFMEIFSDVIQVFFATFFLRKIFKMAPIHHHFEMIGWSLEKIVMRFYFFSAVFGLVGAAIALYL